MLHYRNPHGRSSVEWTSKAAITYTDAVTLVRRDLWCLWIFENPAYQSVVEELSRKEKRQLIGTVKVAR